MQLLSLMLHFFACLQVLSLKTKLMVKRGVCKTQIIALDFSMDHLTYLCISRQALIPPHTPVIIKKDMPV